MKLLALLKIFGSDVSGIMRGDQVLVFPWIGCGECPACQVGNENLCDAPKSMVFFRMVVILIML